jgi:hypothetical protein
MSGGNEWAELGRTIYRPPDLQALSFLLHRRNEPVEDWPLDIDSFHAQTNLASIQEHGLAHLLNGLVAFAIGEYDCRILAAKFKRDRLHAPGTRLHDGSTSARLASESDSIDLRTAHQVFASRTFPKTMREVKNAVRHPGTAHHLS